MKKRSISLIIWGRVLLGFQALWGVQAQAHDLGVHGHTFIILERDLQEVIEGRLKGLSKSGELSNHMEKIQNSLADQIKHPQSGVSLPRAITPKTYTYNPALIVPYDLKDHQGKVFYKAGTKINPLDWVTLSKELVFFDGGDPEQVYWVQNYIQDQKSFKLILTQGSPFELMEKLNTSLFFDQHGFLSKKLKLMHVPAVVRQQGKVLLIEEIVLKTTLENKDHVHSSLKLKGALLK